jgi:protein involved in polysaccharide export with SLBB domain
MVRNRAFSSRRLVLVCAAAMLLASADAQAQMTAGGVSGMQAVEAAQNPGTVMTTAPQPTSAYSNPYSNNGVASSIARPTINGQSDPYAPTSSQGVATGQYATPLGSPSIMPSNLQTMPNNGQAYGGAPGYYGGAGEPTTAPSYSVQAQPANGPYAPAPQAYAPPPQYAQQPQYAPQPYSLPYTPAQQQYGQPQYAPPPQYVQPQYAPPPQYAQPAPGAPGMTSVAMAPGNNLIPSPYAAVRAAANPVAPGGQTVEGGYTLGPGDKLRLTVFGETDMSGEYQLDGNGNIRIPLAGVVHAAGNTPQGFEAVVYHALVPNYLRNPRINVEILVYRPVYVLGQVGKPGQYAYVNDMTMLNAIGLAGGFTPQSKESVVYVRHEGETKEQPVSTSEPLLIRPGDTIRVDTTLFWDAMNMFAPLSGPAYLATNLH